MNHMIKSILSGFSILLFSNFVRGELFEICKPNPTSPITIHFTWVGSDLFDQKNAQIVKNLENFCAALQYKPIKRDVPEIIDSEIFLWTEKSLSKSLEKICPNINIKQKNVSELLTDEVLKNGYEFFKNNNLFALASDTLRPILMKKYGGCYFDIGKKYSDRTFISTSSDEKNNTFYVLPRSVLWLDTPFYFETEYKLPVYSESTTRTSAGTSFHNTSFMAAKNVSPVPDKIIDKYKTNLKTVLLNPILQVFFDKNIPLYNAQAVFSSVGPLAFTTAILPEMKTIGIATISALDDEGGTKSWSNDLLAKKVSSEARMSFIFALLTCAKDHNYLTARQAAEIFTNSEGKKSDAIGQSAYLFKSLFDTTDLTKKYSGKKITLNDINKFNDKLQKYETQNRIMNDDIVNVKDNLAREKQKNRTLKDMIIDLDKSSGLIRCDGREVLSESEYKDELQNKNYILLGSYSITMPWLKNENPKDTLGCRRSNSDTLVEYSATEFDLNDFEKSPLKELLNKNSYSYFQELLHGLEKELEKISQNPPRCD
jgi:hypothetical protein